jgi:glycosyltransferase involved in cell wall biosynthesis
VPRATVVIPTHNRPQLLGRALDSLAAQTFRDFEVVVVNDGGTDVSSTLGADRGLRTRLIDHGVNRGRSAALNTGIDAAEGDLLAILADDDRFYPHHLGTVVRAWDALGLGHAVYSHAVQVLETSDGQVVDRKVTGAQDFNHDLLLVTNYICAIAILVPTATLKELQGFDTSFDVLEDWELWLRVAERLTWHHVDVPTVEYRVREGRGNSTTREFFRFHPALERVYAKHPLASGSPLQASRDELLVGSQGRVNAYGFAVSVVIACQADPGEVVPTLQNVVEVLGSASYEVVLLVPTVDGWGELLSNLKGDLQTYAVGGVDAEAAWEWARQRAAGRHLLLLRAGEVLDLELVASVLKQAAGASLRVGRSPVLAG